MTEEELINKGYTRYDENDNHRFVDYILQKRFDDDIGKKYFITVRKWNFTGCGNKIEGPIRYEAEIQFYSKNDHKSMNVTYLYGWEIDEIEEDAEFHFQSGRYDYYEKFL